MSILVLDIQTTGSWTPGAHFRDLEKFSQCQIDQISWGVYNSTGYYIRGARYTLPNAENKKEKFFDGITEGDDVPFLSTQQRSHSHMELIMSKLCQDLRTIETIVGYGLPYILKILLSELFRIDREDMIQKVLSLKLYCIYENARKLRKWDTKRPTIGDIYQRFVDPAYPYGIERFIVVKRCYFKMVKEPPS